MFLPYLHVMTLLAYNEDPSEVKYKHSDLQEHFINYFTKNRSFFSTGVTTFYQRSGTWQCFVVDLFSCLSLLNSQVPLLILKERMTVNIISWVPNPLINESSYASKLYICICLPRYVAILLHAQEKFFQLMSSQWLHHMH